MGGSSPQEDGRMAVHLGCTWWGQEEGDACKVKTILLAHCRLLYTQMRHYDTDPYPALTMAHEEIK
jgi:hypothetical protein